MQNGTKTEQMLDILANGGDTSSMRGCCNTKTQNLILDAADRVQAVEDEVERLENNPDVVDIVDTYADLQSYDKSTLTDKDIIRVLTDETHGGKSTYYRYNAGTGDFDFVGEIAGGGDSVYSTKTTSSNNVGGAVYIGNLNANQETQEDPTTTDNHYKYFWAIPGANTTVPTQSSVNILGNEADEYGIALGWAAKSKGSQVVAIGQDSEGYGNRSVALGPNSRVHQGVNYGVALGAYSHATRTGEVNIGAYLGSSKYGYNNSEYRVLGGVYDGQLDNDAVNVSQINGLIDAINTATGSNIPHIGAQS